MRRGHSLGSARMMDCALYRRSMLVDPHDPDPQLREHRESCHDCTLYTERLLRFESRLERALRVTLPANSDPATQANSAANGDSTTNLDPVAPVSDRVVPLRAKS